MRKSRDNKDTDALAKSLEPMWRMRQSDKPMTEAEKVRRNQQWAFYKLLDAIPKNALDTDGKILAFLRANDAQLTRFGVGFDGLDVAFRGELQRTAEKEAEARLARLILVATNTKASRSYLRSFATHMLRWFKQPPSDVRLTNPYGEGFRDIKLPEPTLEVWDDTSWPERIYRGRIYYQTGSPWISVNDRLPTPDTRVLTIDVDGYIDTNAYFTDETAPRWASGAIFEVTHWMPLPEPPK